MKENKVLEIEVSMTLDDLFPVRRDRIEVEIYVSDEISNYTSTASAASVSYPTSSEILHQIF
jgi:hypothetical protein